MKRQILAALALVAFSGCSLNTHFNKPVATREMEESRSTFDIRHDRGERDVLVLLALSGGGSRAAYFSGNVMLRLQQVFPDLPDLDLLQEVDVISSVSGGSLPAAYYAISKDRSVRLYHAPPRTVTDHRRVAYDSSAGRLSLKGRVDRPEADALRQAFRDDRDRHQFDRLLAQQHVRSNRFWDEETVKDLMSRNYIARWIGNWFWPHNIVRYWFTSYDRSDIMAQTFADNLYDVRPLGGDLTFRDLNPERPYLIVNATNGTESVDETDKPFGSVFTYTEEDFAEIGSDVKSYSVARAVMASATFPVVFNFMTLKNYRHSAKRPRYLHLFDGGNSDNLGLTSLKRLLLDEQVNRPGRYRRVILILVDAYVPSKGVDRNEGDGRSLFSYVADMNVVDAVDSLLEANREHVMNDFRKGILETTKDCETKRHLPERICKSPNLEAQKEMVRRQLFMYHVKFENSRSVRDKLMKIPTHFRLTEDRDGVSNAIYLEKAAEELIAPDNPCLQRIREILRNPDARERAGEVRYCDGKTTAN